MEKKWIKLCIVLVILLFAIGSVSAADLFPRNFDDYFSMKVPKNVNFQEDVDETYFNGTTMVFATYTSDNIGIIYMDSFMFSENSSSSFYQSTFEGFNPDSTKCYESQEGDLKILEPIPKNDLSLSLVGKSSGNKILIVAGDNLSIIKQMAQSAKFK
ncbi:hypothetical protein [uncultured Methanobrevibacter sp.]|uniref:hypothetical protein n=1 Tax=uncultured Methanobrevibacter sp. TaxID=253161 RepID=UPI002623E767|nr:hypothetical protein [uncultured Methanobrevibacter sp.]